MTGQCVRKSLYSHIFKKFAMKKEIDPQTLQPASMSNFALLWADFGVSPKLQTFSRTSWYFCAVDVAVGNANTDANPDVVAGSETDKHKI